MIIRRRETRQVQVGGVRIGGGAPVAVQSMNNTRTTDVEGSLAQIRQLAAAGCELTRLAVPDQAAVAPFAVICERSPLPIVADIHFDYRLALEAIAAGAAALRINPGNIGSEERVRRIAAAARLRQIPIRVGVNAGSLSAEMLSRHGGVKAETMVASALESIQQLEACDFSDICVSIKASDPLLTIESYRLLAEQTNYPLHVGLTEAGLAGEGVIRSAIGIGVLLTDGIGDTIRVSLTGDPVQEVRAAYSILKALGLRRRGPELISCPTCGRTDVDLVRLAEQVAEAVKDYTEPLRIAVMGCAVNGPGEAREADIGLAGGKGQYLIFRKGEIIRKVSEAEALPVFLDEIDQLRRTFQEDLSRDG